MSLTLPTTTLIAIARNLPVANMATNVQTIIDAKRAIDMMMIDMAEAVICKVYLF